MNEPNSTLKRLINKLNYLDAIDKQSGSGKLDIMIQFPYSIKTEAKRLIAEKRRKDVEEQLSNSQYGIAYVDGTEKVTQLNRPAENNLMVQIEYLTSMLYSQLGLTEAIFDGNASESEMLNYYNRTVEPVVSCIVDGLRRTFLTKTARSQGQTIQYLKNPFSLVTAKDLAELADKFTRNEILSSNEFRSIIGYKPDNDPKSDELRNKNLNVPNEENQGEKKTRGGKSGKRRIKVWKTMILVAMLLRTILNAKTVALFVKMHLRKMTVQKCLWYGSMVIKNQLMY